MIARGNLHGERQAIAVLEDGADIISFGRAALANPDLPRSFAAGSSSKALDSKDARTDREYQRGRTIGMTRRQCVDRASAKCDLHTASRSDRWDLDPRRRKRGTFDFSIELREMRIRETSGPCHSKFLCDVEHF